MADEITIYSGITITKSNLSRQINPATISADLAGSRVLQNSQAVGTTHEALEVADLASAGWASFKNLDATNFVQIGVEVAATFYPVAKLLPGEVATMRLSTLTLFAKADTSAVNLDCLISEA